MFDEITRENEVSIKIKIRNCIFNVIVFENIITQLAREMMFEICWASKGYNGR